MKWWLNLKIGVRLAVVFVVILLSQLAVLTYNTVTNSGIFIHAEVMQSIIAPMMGRIENVVNDWGKVQMLMRDAIIAPTPEATQVMRDETKKTIEILK